MSRNHTAALHLPPIFIPVELNLEKPTGLGRTHLSVCPKTKRFTLGGNSIECLTFGLRNV
ncbi:hypothetical protein [Iningainema tapete]|uniref:Uncharacterized protein n=1 Tax=Iningainema tapete BLCC-T55 TaxID=2748662 RepID=A0A8J6XFZ5_9CYAN|nr:hypothetical protein [Iningainema tapete]MBD2775104.1 hypothetical protein [Iningainema tapete BLCC-T55]